MGALLSLQQGGNVVPHLGVEGGQDDDGGGRDTHQDVCLRLDPEDLEEPPQLLLLAPDVHVRGPGAHEHLAQEYSSNLSNIK